MAKVLHYLNRVVSSRYLSDKDVSKFIDTISLLSKSGLICQPQVLVLRSSSSLKKSFDILLDTGITPKQLAPYLEDYTLYYYTLYSKEYYKVVATIDTSDFPRRREAFGYASILFERIAKYIVDNISGEVELRGVNKK